MTSFGAVIPQGVNLDLPEIPPVAQFSFIEKFATNAERAGLNSIWSYDHFHTIPEAPRSCFECWTTLSALAAKTHKIRLGQIVTCNSYRNPAHLAKMASVLDVISNGRLDFGIGAGWYDPEYRAYGVPFEKANIRIGKLDEAVQIIRKMWTEDSTSFRGKYYSVDGAINFPKPVQKPHPPILIGGEGEQLLLKVVAKYASACNFSGSIENYRRKLNALSKHCRDVGRDFNEITKTYLTDILIQRSPQQSDAILRRMEHAELLVGNYLGSDRFEQLSADQYRNMNIVGTPPECVEQLKRYVDAGVDYFLLHFPLVEQIESLTLFAEEVMPQLQ
jgi:F420-dependent oxidoreductase-like protein